MRKTGLFILTIILLMGLDVSAQTRDFEIGRSNPIMNRQGGFYDYADPNAINMMVSVWGYVKFPGRYLVPSYTSVTDLISLAGGPEVNAEFDDLRLYRVAPDSSQTLFKFSYNDLMWEENLILNNRKIPELKTSDILVVPGSPRLFFKDWLGIALSVLSAMISLTILILNISRG